MGFGISVIQRLCKTSVKKNLYWEIKDKIFEESWNGVRSVKRSQKVRVYGTDSNREVRARLIEILYDRVANHKDKFIAPILHQEMQGMEVKKNGKVEHSQNSHDDQVFSYLMALYVWYDGKNLAENFHLFKNTIKTDTDIDVEALEIEDSLEATAKVDVSSVNYDPDSTIIRDLEFIEANSIFITTEDIRAQYYDQQNQMRDFILSTNKEARESYCRETGVDPSMYMNSVVSNTIMLPDSIFTNEFDLFDDEESRKQSVLQGNLRNWWDQV